MDPQQPNFPYIEILEQPASKGIRFRYECEGRATGCIPGENSDADRRTYPSIRIVGYEGRAVIVISCVTKDEPYMPHPHSIVGKDLCNRGVCTLERFTHQEPIIFSNLGIQCVKKKEIEDALKQRENVRVDPFKTGFDINPQSIDLGVVRLCFQAFLQGRDGKFHIPLEPVVSNPIFDKKAINELVITKLSHSSAPVSGGMEMILLCEKVVKDNIQIVFYEMRNDQMIWRAFGEFTPGDVHKQTAIAFRTPRYPGVNVTNPIQVYIQLRRLSDGITSEPMPFTLMSLDIVGEIANSLKRKRQRFNTSEVMNSQIYNQPVYKSTCQNQGASAAAATMPTTAQNEPYRIKLLEQLEAEAESRRDVEMIDKRLNQQNVGNNNRVDEQEMTLKTVAPSIFPARFTYNAGNKWNSTNNQSSHMSSSHHQNGDASNQYESMNAPSQYQNRDVSNQYQHRNVSNQFHHRDVSNQYQNGSSQQPVVQHNPQCIPSTSEQPSMPPPSSSFDLPLLPIQRQNESMNNQNQTQGPTLYRIQKPTTDNNILDNIPTPMDFNSNNLHFDVNPLDVLKELNSEDLAGLSDTFSASFSLADPVEFERIKNL